MVCTFSIRTFAGFLLFWMWSICPRSALTSGAEQFTTEAPRATTQSLIRNDSTFHRNHIMSHVLSDDVSLKAIEAKFFIKKLFSKYGNDGILSFEGFEHLIGNVGLGVDIDDHDIHDHKLGPNFVDLHDNHKHKSAKAESGRTARGGKSATTKLPNHQRRKNRKRQKKKGNGRKSRTSQPATRHRRAVPDTPPHGSLADTCLSPKDFMSLFNIHRNISLDSFMYMCPAILYQIDTDTCHNKNKRCPNDHQAWEEHCRKYHGVPPDKADQAANTSSVAVRSFYDIPGKVWGYAVLSVSVISLVGLLAVAIIPVMNKALYHYLIDFLVALAIGTLTGDALLHLIPHALIEEHSSEKKGEGEGHDDHSDAIWKGFVVLAGLYFFFLAERMMAMIGERKKRNKLKKKLAALEVDSDDNPEVQVRIGEKLSQPQRNSSYLPSAVNRRHSGEKDQLNGEDLLELDHLHDYDEETRGNGGHGHGHNHGHSHTVPGSVSAIAWMVIMGDGLHNFSDGLAIGAAFANSLTVGLSTSIAVFCHELPHELGDFAVLLKAGMSVKHALFYNIVSSVLCFLGLVIGVAVGNIASASTWIFAMTAGTFIYISLVDMLPEIAVSKHRDGATCNRLMLQMFGISTGVTIMLLIALFESDIKIK